MAKRVFFSFHYQDIIDFRANVVRNHWVTKPDREAAGFFDASIWESAKKTGDIALKRLINGALNNTSVTAVLIGENTFSRKWVRYELVKSLEVGNKLVGVHINKIPCKNKQCKPLGTDPFDHLGYRYSEDGASISILEWSGTKWVTYVPIPTIKLTRKADSSEWGKGYKFSHFAPTYCWSKGDGYNNFASWVE